MGQMATTPKEPFPFMRLPPELRNMVYKELLVQPGMICIQFRGCPPGESVQRADGRGSDHCIDVKALRQLLWTSKTIYQEAAPFYFGSNHFRFQCLGTLTKCLQRLRPDSRRLLRRITVSFSNSTPARAMKLLGTCVSLSELTLEMCLGTAWSSRRKQDGRMQFNGLNDLLKIRGLDKFTVDTTHMEPYREEGHNIFFDEKGLADVLEVLKEPRNPAKLRRAGGEGLSG